jgi:hypothetical protein
VGRVQLKEPIMNRQEREIIDTVDRILKIPLPATGSQTTSIKGLASYAADMRELTPYATRLISIIRQGETWKGETREVLDEANQAIDDRLKMLD